MASHKGYIVSIDKFFSGSWWVIMHIQVEKEKCNDGTLWYTVKQGSAA